MEMEPFQMEDPLWDYAPLLPRKTKKKTRPKTGGTKISPKTAAIICVVVAVVLIALIILSIIMHKRRQARIKKHTSTVPGYSNDNSGGLYGGTTPGFFAGRWGGGKQQPNGQDKPPANGGAGHQGDYGNYGGENRYSQGEAASYYNDGQYAQGGGAPGGGYGMPQRPPMTFNPSPAPGR